MPDQELQARTVLEMPRCRELHSIGLTRTLWKIRWLDEEGPASLRMLLINTMFQALSSCAWQAVKDIHKLSYLKFQLSYKGGGTVAILVFKTRKLRHVEKSNFLTGKLTGSQ